MQVYVISELISILLSNVYICLEPTVDFENTLAILLFVFHKILDTVLVFVDA